MPGRIFSRDGIAISATDASGRPKYILKEWQRFELEAPGVYTLEGPNQAGKSVLIKMLMGVLPPRVKGDKGGSTLIDDTKTSIRHVADAHRHGLVSVFQDDDLIPSMTIGEQLRMRHATPLLQNYANLLGRKFYSGLGIKRITNEIGVAQYLRRFEPKERDAFPAVRVEEDARLLLSRYGDEFPSIVDQYPRQLSGGAKSVARLVQAQLTPGVRVLFLDEAFSGVHADVWPRLVETLKEWAEEGKRCLVVVSHNQRELIQWQPRKRFVIENHEVQEKGIKGYVSLQPGLPRKSDAFPIFAPPYDGRWCEPFTEPVVVLVDRAVRQHPALNKITSFLYEAHLRRIEYLEVEMSEPKKSWDEAAKLLDRVFDVVKSPRGMFVVVGGGAMLNMGGLIAALVFRGRLPYVLVPTTIMAIADVAVGSKTGVNFFPGSKSAVPLKNAVGMYENPAALLLDPDFLEGLPTEELKSGLAEVLKHGLLQSKSLWNDTLKLLRDPAPDRKRCYELALRTMKLKRTLLSLDPWEDAVSRILLYGHLHAHAVERASDFAVPHGRAVIVGILIELKLGSHDVIYSELLAIAQSSQLVDAVQLRGVDRTRLAQAYGDPFLGKDLPWVISVDEIGEYGSGGTVPLRVQIVAWRKVLEAYDTVLSDLVIEGTARRH